jgi:hypothetical protein
LQNELSLAETGTLPFSDASGPLQPRAFAYDLENRPIAIFANGQIQTMAYGPDGERVKKAKEKR